MTRLLALVLLILVPASQAWAQNKVALVIGNGAYETVPPLRNPGSDAGAMSDMLASIGFQVIRGQDLPLSGMRAAIRDFSVAAETAQIALFYYAGHGMQVAGKNYLLPTDAAIEREADLDFAAVELDLVLRQLERAPAARVILLDACRDNPFETRLSRSMGQSRSSAVLGRGLAPIETDGGSFIGFATDPGDVAYDGSGNHSPFTQALLDHLATPGLEINAMMTRVRADVFSETERLQRPWSTSSLLDELFLAEPETDATQDALIAEVALWQTIQQSANPEDFQSYLAAYPNGLFADLARARLGAETTEPTPVPEQPDVVAALRPQLRPEGVPRAQPDPSPAPKATSDCAFCPEMIGLAAGEFILGTDAANAPAAERPARQVTLSSFEMSATEITVDQFSAYLESSGRAVPKGCFVWTSEGKMRRQSGASFLNPGVPVSGDTPAACINWQDATHYAEWLSEVTGLTYRLPSEAELEYAIRAGSADMYPWPGGTPEVCTRINAADSGSRFRWRNIACDDGVPALATAGAFPPNALGLYEIQGNLWEWAGDCWNGSHRAAPSDGTTRTTGVCSSRVLRGGSWDDPLENLHATYRVGIPADRRQANVGFRVVRERP